jgi:hypothetical protein
MKTLQTIIDELKRAGRCYQGINDEEKCVAHGVNVNSPTDDEVEAIQACIDANDNRYKGSTGLYYGVQALKAGEPSSNKRHAYVPDNNQVSLMPWKTMQVLTDF